jgi:integrase
MIEIGMRCYEVYQLKRQNVFLDKCYLQVTNRKTKSSNWHIYLSDTVSKVLMCRIEKFKGDSLFPQNEKDFENSTDNLTKRHLEVVKRLGYTFRLYYCRHTFAKRAIESAVDLVTLAAILGYTSLKMLTRHCHPSEQQKAEAIKNRFEAKAA